MPRIVLSLIAFTFLLPASAAAGRSAVASAFAVQAPPPAEAGARSDSLIAALLQAAHERGIFQGNALVARDGEIIYQGGLGTADAAGAIPLTPAHRFLIGSVSKHFSAVGLMVLKEEGLLDLDDPVSRHLPGLPEWSDRVRVRDLLAYSSGLPQVRYGVVEDEADIWDDLRALRELKFEPGTAYSYNNNDIFLRQGVIQAVSGLSYPEFARTRLLEPCGMTAAAIDPAPGDPLLAMSFDEERVEDAWRSPMAGHPAVTTTDLYRWTRCIESGTLIPDSSLVALTRPFRDGVQSPLGHSGMKDGELQWYGDAGNIAHYEALQYVNRVDGITVVLLTNSKQHQVWSLTGAIEQVLKGEPYEMPEKSLEMSVRARMLHHGFDAGLALLERIEREGGDRYDLSQVEKDLTETGEYLLEVGHAADAARVYELALQRFPESAAARTGLADATRADLARMDSVFFDALFTRCDAEAAIALLADDIEFYDDRTGLSVGPDLREDFRRLADNCPAGNGVRRVLLPHSVDVSPIAGYGAVQTGVHHFVERGGSTSTVAEFVHVWRRVGDEWRLARIISVHETMDAARAAERRTASHI